MHVTFEVDVADDDVVVVVVLEYVVARGARAFYGEGIPGSYMLSL